MAELDVSVGQAEITGAGTADVVDHADRQQSATFMSV